MATNRRLVEAFGYGLGAEAVSHTCAECGYTSENRKNFRRSDDGDLVCTTGHYTTKDGDMRRQKNAYARHPLA